MGSFEIQTILALPIAYVLRFLSKKYINGKYLILVGFLYIAVAIASFILIKDISIKAILTFGLSVAGGVLIGDWCHFAKNYKGSERDKDEI